jgi:hypothetical protein
MGRALPLLAGLSFMALAATATWAQIIIEPVPNPADKAPQDREHSLRILPEPGTAPEPGLPEPSTPEIAFPAVPPVMSSPATSPVAVSIARLALLNSTIKVENPAGVSLELMPDLTVEAGSKVGFRITTRKAGYVIILDINASGKLTQLFPNTATVTRGQRDVSNLVRPGRPLTIPQAGTPFANFEFVAEPPPGIAMAVAVLSDRPVQVVDLPDAPPPAAASGEMLKFVRNQVLSLRIAGRDGGLEQPSWSIDGRFYAIK